MSQSEYYMPQANSYIRVEHFHLYTNEDLIEMLHYWFNENYIDPAEICPYEKGEYIYIYGGPIEPEEAFNKEFKEIIETNILQKALQELPNPYNDFSLLPDINWSDYTATNPYFVFNEHIDDIRRLSAVHNNNLLLQQKYMGMLFANVVTTFEIFISDTLIQTIHKNEEYRNNFLNSVNIKLSIKKLWTVEYKRYWFEIIEKIYSITFSNSKKLNKNFCEVLDINLSKINIQELEKASETRNDIMHRNGKNKKGEDIQTDESTLEWCINTVVDIVKEITAKENTNTVSIQIA